MKWFCKEEWSKITPHLCATWISNYSKRFVKVLTAKGGPGNTRNYQEIQGFTYFLYSDSEQLAHVFNRLKMQWVLDTGLFLPGRDPHLFHTHSPKVSYKAQCLVLFHSHTVLSRWGHILIWVSQLLCWWHTTHVSFPPSDTSAWISAYLAGISSWMASHQMKLNPSKNESVYIPGSLYHDIAFSLDKFPDFTICHCMHAWGNQGQPTIFLFSHC